MASITDMLQSWLPIINFLLIGVCAFILFTIRSSYQAGKWGTELTGKVASLEVRMTDVVAKALMLEPRTAELVNRVTSLENRMNRAGEELSELGTHVQGMPERFRVFFISHDYKELADEKLSHTNDAVARLEQRISVIERELRESRLRGGNREV